jgi:hypothetical protein
MKTGPFHKHTSTDIVSRVVFLLAILVIILDMAVWRP